MHHYPSGCLAAGLCLCVCVCVCVCTCVCVCFEDVRREMWSGGFLGPEWWIVRVTCLMTLCLPHAQPQTSSDGGAICLKFIL